MYKIDNKNILLSILVIFFLNGCFKLHQKLEVIEHSKISVLNSELPAWIKYPSFNGKIASIGKCRPTANDKNQMQFAIDRALISLSKGLANEIDVVTTSNIFLKKSSDDFKSNIKYKSNTKSRIVSNGNIKVKLTHIFYDKDKILYIRLESL